MRTGVVAALVVAVGVASAGGSTGGVAQTGLLASDMRLSRSVGMQALARSLRWPVVRSAGPVAGLPGRTGLVKGTIGKDDLGETALGFGKLWVVEQPWRMVRGRYHQSGQVLAVDVRTHRTVGKPIPVGRGAFGVGVGAGSVWVVNSSDGTVSRIDPKSRRVVATITLGGHSLGQLAVSHGLVWVVREDYDMSKHGGELIRIDPATNRVLGPTVLGKNMCGSFGMALTRDAIWVTGDAQMRVIRIDPTTGQIVARIRMKGAPIGPVVARGSLWVANETEGPIHLWRIDPATNVVTDVVRFKGLGWPLQLMGRQLWTSDGTTISTIDPVEGTVGMTISVPNTYQFVLDRRTLWAVSWDSVGTGAVRWVDLRVPLVTLDPTTSRVG